MFYSSKRCGYSKEKHKIKPGVVKKYTIENVVAINR